MRFDHAHAETRGEIPFTREVALCAECQGRNRLHRATHVNVDAPVDGVEHSHERADIAVRDVDADQVWIRFDELRHQLGRDVVAHRLVRRENNRNRHRIEHLHRYPSSSSGRGR